MYVNIRSDATPDWPFMLRDMDIEVRNIRHDEAVTVCKSSTGRIESVHFGKKPVKPKVERVIFDGPATIVFWSDGDKTVAKCSECHCGKTKCPIPRDVKHHRCKLYSKEKGLMAAMLKKLYRNFEDVMREAGAYNYD